MKARAILSIHDLTPGTLPQVVEILGFLEDARIPRPTLLVVPGRGWEGETLARLGELDRLGYPLAAHGWIHQAPRPTTLLHHLHARILSRDQGEHLSRSRAALVEMVQRSHEWFGEQGLSTPITYVPPAWAMGSLTRRDLISLPFLSYECLAGILDGRSGRLHPLPLAGFEADTPSRRVGLRIWNALNRWGARIFRRPLRISIHPSDRDLLLAQDLERMIREPWEYIEETDVHGGGDARDR